MAYRLQKEGKGVRSRLDFNPGENAVQREEGGRAQMMIDNEEVAIPSGEISKRRLLGKNVGGEYDKVRVIEGGAQGSSTTFLKAEVAMQPRPAQ